MKPFLFLLCIFIGVQTTFSQDVMKMEDNLTTTFTLTKMTVIQTDKINLADFQGTDKTYFAKVKFGKRSFDIGIYKTGTQELQWGHYPILKGNDYFRKNIQKSSSTTEVYSLTREIMGGKEVCEVTFYKGYGLSVSVAYWIEKPGQKKFENMVMGSGDIQ